jgi:tetratricopeptide (TPR) repeat protein
MKLLLISLFFLTSIFASQNNDYKKALDAYSSKNYKLSAKLFKRLFLNNMSEDKYSFYLGKSYYQLGKYNLAISTFERILINKDNIRAEFEIARVYFKQKNYLESQKIFENILVKVKSVKLKKNIKNYLSIIDEKLNKHSFDGLIMLGVSYDSNLNNRANDDTFDIGNVTYQNTTEKQSSYATEELGLLHYSYKKSARLTIQNKLLASIKTVDDYSEHNLNVLSINPYVSYLYDTNIDVDYGFYFNRIWYGDRLYLNSYGSNLEVNYKVSELKSCKVKFNINQKINKVKDYKDNDVNHYELFFSMTNKSTQIFTYTPSVKVIAERKLRNSTTAIDYNAINFKFAIKRIYKNRYIFMPYISYELKRYSDENNIYNKKQSDNELNIVATGLYVISKNRSFQSSIGYYNIDSNIDSSEYDKYKCSFYLVNKF